MASESTAARQQNVILNIIGIDACDLKPEDRICSICQETLQPILHFKTSRTPEPPVKLAHCGHVFGVRCIFRWLMAHGNCPLCRRKLPPLVLPSQREVPAQQDNESSGQAPVMRRLIRIPALRRPTPAPALPLPAQTETPISRDAMNNSVDEESDEGPRWTPASIRRNPTDISAGEASEAMARLSVEDNGGQEGNTEASATAENQTRARRNVQASARTPVSSNAQRAMRTRRAA